MLSSTSFLTPAIAATLLLAAPILGQAATATPANGVSSGPAAAMTDGPHTINEASLVDALLPEASITSLSPAQESKLAADASAYFEAYTASRPISKLEADAFINQLIGGNSDPSPQQSSYILGLLAEAQTGIPANPTAYVASIESAVSPFAFAGPVSSYAEDLVQGLRTVVASDLSLPVPTQSSHNAAGPARSAPTGIVGVAAAAAAGAIGAALV